jgi:hypothetical protein
VSDTSAFADSALEELFADLAALRIALDEENHDAAAQLVDSHDRRLRQYCENQDSFFQAPVLQELLLLQQSLMRQMIHYRDAAATQLRTGRQSVRAAKAYHQAESLE